MQESNILLYETEDGNVNVDVILKDYMIKRFVIDVDKMKNLELNKIENIFQVWMKCIKNI